MVDALLKAVSVSTSQDISLEVTSVCHRQRYRKRDPENADEVEFVENLWNSLCFAMTDSPENQVGPSMTRSCHFFPQAAFAKGEGLELMINMIRKKMYAKAGAVKTLDYALLRASRCVVVGLICSQGTRRTASDLWTRRVSKYCLIFSWARQATASFRGLYFLQGRKKKKDADLMEEEGRSTICLSLLIQSVLRRPRAVHDLRAFHAPVRCAVPAAVPQVRGDPTQLPCLRWSSALHRRSRT